MNHRALGLRLAVHHCGDLAGHYCTVPRDALLHMHPSYTVSVCKVSHTEDDQYTPKSSPDSGVSSSSLNLCLGAVTTPHRPAGPCPTKAG